MISPEISKSYIQKRLAIYQKQPLDNPYPATSLRGKRQLAAVLLPLFVKDHQWHVLFIRRAENQHDYHGGQVAFPGGRMDSSDPNLETTALREAQEEIGIHPEDVDRIGCLRDIITVTNYQVTPVVGIIPWPYHFTLAPQEASRVFGIPLNWLANPENYDVRSRTLQNPAFKTNVVYFQQYDGELLWGATARITLHLIEALEIQP